MLRHVGVLFFGAVVACGGEIAPDASGHTSAPQQAGERDEAPETATAAPAKHVHHGRVSVIGGGTPSRTFPDECWDYGTPAGGDCMVGDRQICPSYYGTS